MHTYDAKARDVEQLARVLFWSHPIRQPELLRDMPMALSMVATTTFEIIRRWAARGELAELEREVKALQQVMWEEDFALNEKLNREK